MSIHTHTMVAAVGVVLATAACKKEDQKADEAAEAAGPAVTEEAGEPTGEAPEQEPEESEELTKAKELWSSVASAYKQWPKASPEPTKAGEPHGAFVHAYYNDVVAGALDGEGDWPEGSILVKQNFAASEDGSKPGEMVALTVMNKSEGEWFWAKYEPDGTLATTEGGAPVAGGEDTPCYECHDEQQWRDHVVTRLVAAE